MIIAAYTRLVSSKDANLTTRYTLFVKKLRKKPPIRKENNCAETWIVQETLFINHPW